MSEVIWMYLFTWIKTAARLIVSEMKEILLYELTILEDIGTGKFAVSSGFSLNHWTLMMMLWIFRPRRMHAVHRCGVLLQISHVPVCLCVGHTGVLCKNGWIDQETFGVRTQVGPRNRLLDRGQRRTNRFAVARDDKKRGFDGVLY